MRTTSLTENPRLRDYRAARPGRYAILGTYEGYALDVPLAVALRADTAAIKLDRLNRSVPLGWRLEIALIDG